MYKWIHSYFPHVKLVLHLCAWVTKLPWKNKENARSPVPIRGIDIEFEVIRLIHWYMPHAQRWPRHPELPVGIMLSLRRVEWVLRYFWRVESQALLAREHKNKGRLTYYMCMWVRNELALIPAGGFLFRILALWRTYTFWFLNASPSPSYQLEETLVQKSLKYMWLEVRKRTWGDGWVTCFLAENPIRSLYPPLWWLSAINRNRNSCYWIPFIGRLRLAEWKPYKKEMQP